MDDLTIIYYTCNMEKPEFESKIQKSLLDAIGDRPLVSVSQKPMNFGKNICVGEVGRSPFNVWRQFQIGVQEAETKFVCPAEADFLYPKERFEFKPDREDVFYTMEPVFMLHNGEFLRLVMGVSDASVVVGRDYAIESLKTMLSRNTRGRFWEPEPKQHRLKRPFYQRNLHSVRLPVPILTFKTPENMNPFDSHYRKRGNVDILPHWGTVRELTGKYLQ